MVQQLSKELPVAIGVSVIPSRSGSYSVRAAGFYEPTLLFNPLYSNYINEFGTQAHGQVRQKFVQVVNTNHLANIADLLELQDNIFLEIEDRFADYISERKLSRELVQTVFRGTADSYRKLSFAEQSSRFQKLQEASGSQLDLCEAIRNPEDTRFVEIFLAYQRMHKIVRDLAAVTSRASALYDAAAKHIFGYSLPTDLGAA